jgi:ABC-type branched-subunit amino acid transport system substrate-binding protein
LLVLAALAAALPVSCTLLQSKFTECETPADCASRGDNFVCENNFCVPLPPSCKYIGSQSGKAVTFGCLQPRTNQDGTVGAWGPTWERLVELVVNQVNSQHNGIGGTPVRVIACDTNSKTDVARDLALYMIDAGVSAIFSDGSGETIAEAAVTVPANVLLMSGASTSPAITFLKKTMPDAGPGALPLVWRTTPSDALQAPIIARVILGDTSVGVGDVGPFLRDGGASSLDAGSIPVVAVLQRDDSYGNGLYSSFQSTYPAAYVRGPCLFAPGGDVTSALTQCAGYNADVVVIIGFPNETSNLLKGAAAFPSLSNDTRWFFTQGGLYSGIFSEPNQAPLRRAIGTAPAAENPQLFLAAAVLYADYQQQYNETPGLVVDFANMYDAAMLVMIAAEAASSEGSLNGTKLAEKLVRVSADAGSIALTRANYTQLTMALSSGASVNIEGASGKLDFDNVTAEAPANMQVWTIADGGFVTLKVVDPQGL